MLTIDICTSIAVIVKHPGNTVIVIEAEFTAKTVLCYDAAA